MLATMHPVRDFEQWKNFIASQIDAMGDAGIVRRWVYRSLDDPNEVMIALEVESLEKARELLPSYRMQELLDGAGVEVYPPVFLGECVDDLTLDRHAS
jgi:hypothetical protein